MLTAQNITINQGGTMNVCSGTFYDSGDSNSNYGINETYVMSFCSGTSEAIRFDFLSFTTGAGDDLTAYDGSTTAAPAIGTYSGNLSPFIITSSGSCITFKFTSNGVLNLAGWAANIVCVMPPPNCNGNQIPADAFSMAPKMCRTTGYCGKTSSFYSRDIPTGFCDNCSLFKGSIENNSWYKFQAFDTVAQFQIDAMNCLAGGGIQAALYSYIGNMFALVSDSNYTSNSGFMNANFYATNLLPGKIYYIMVDGNAGDVCDYTITPLIGIPKMASVFGSQGTCLGEIVNLHASTPTTATFQWSSNPMDPSLVGQETNKDIFVTPNLNTTYAVHIVGSNGFCSVDTNLTHAISLLTPGDPSCTAQLYCYINVTTLSNPIITQGDSIKIQAYGDVFQIPLASTFNNGQMGNGWLTNSVPTIATPCGPGIDSSYTWFDNISSLPRYMQTTAYDVTNGGTIRFLIRYGLQGDVLPCEGPGSPNEGVMLQFSKNNQVWENIIYMNPYTGLIDEHLDTTSTLTLANNQTTNFTNWRSIIVNIPTAARSAGTYFRWIQPVFSSSTANSWGIDSVLITTNKSSIITWTSNPVDPSLQAIHNSMLYVHPMQNTVYTAEINNGIKLCNNSLSIDVVPATLCHASIDAHSVLNNLVITNNSTGNLTSAFWDFGDNSFSNNTNISSHQYADPGFYDVCLTVMDSISGCIDDTCIVASVGNTANLCSADFEYTINANTISFIDSSLGNPTKWFWEFGDGTISNLQNPTHTYNIAGYYHAKLTIRNPATGCMSVYKEIVNAGNVVNDCEAEFGFYSGIAVRKIHFNNMSHVSSFSNYVWNFGDGDTSSMRNPLHVFAQDGFFDVCLSLNSNTGCNDITCKTIAVGNVSNACVSDFMYELDTITKTVVFSNHSTGAPNQWKWNFDDGSQSTLQNPTHSYTSKGLYNVHLLIKNTATGCVSHSNKLLILDPDSMGLNCSFGYLKDTTYNKNGQFPINFMGAICGDAARISWDFGDGTPLETFSLNPTHTYTAKGIYNVELSVEDPIIGESDNYSRIINIDTATSIEKIFKSYTLLTVTPNPVKNRAVISVYTDSTEPVSIEIFDLLGNKIEMLYTNQYVFGRQRAIWDTSNIKSGIYFIRSIGNNINLNKKVIITK